MRTSSGDKDQNQDTRPVQGYGRTDNWISDSLLLVTAIIWGIAFVFQRLGMEHVGPFTFSAARFTLGVAVLIPLGWHAARVDTARTGAIPWRAYLLGGSLAGLALFGGISFQQVGLVYTTAGKAGFITGLYVVIVPILGMTGRIRTSPGTWLGAALSATGLYLLSVTADFSMDRGDGLVFISAFIWALHVHILGRTAPFCNPFVLSIIQYAVCALLSWLVAFAVEEVRWHAMVAASSAILYGGVLSVGIAYTLQVVAQRRAHPAHAAVLLSLEAVFAALGGWLLLGETLSPRGLVGCALMLWGMLVSQLYVFLPRGGRRR